MQTPRRISLTEFGAERQRWIDSYCVTDGEFQRCRLCTGLVEILGVYFSIHNADFDECTGAGKVVRLAVPFCPRCEPRPDECSCLHVHPLFDVEGLAKALLN
jgi:hypothetical protein